MFRIRLPEGSCDIVKKILKIGYLQFCKIEYNSNGKACRKGSVDMKQVESAYFAGGCFWCITPTFRELPGVFDVVSGYSGGEEENPSYEDVKYQRTGHRETIRIDYDPRQVDFVTLMDIFLASVDPHDPDGQFIDRGFSYTLAVYYLSQEQQKAAQERLRRLEEESGQPVYIRLEPFRSFWRAEEGHQDYYRKHPEEFRKELEESGRTAYFEGRK